MSAQFGRWNFTREPPSPIHRQNIDTILARVAPDGGTSFSDASVTIIYRAFHTTKESRSEKQPHVSSSGIVVTWDGRLDNRTELLSDLRMARADAPTDVAIVAAAYEAWGTKCLARLQGDWALSVWNPHTELLLATDFIGTRHLFYSFDTNQITWSTILDPLLLCAGRTFNLDEEYVAGWFSFFPAAHLTAYEEIHAVPPSSFVLLQPGRCTIQEYWGFDSSKRIRYLTDSEYEEHFRAAFRQAVARRLRSDTPVLAELSGGIDSSSIVCVADRILASNAGETPRLDTISCYNDSDPDWNEHPYFTKVEQMRGHAGCHIEVGTPESAEPEFESDIFAATPAAWARFTQASQQFAAALASQGNRVLLSGIGGDEVTGGVPTPAPELMDLFASARFAKFTRQLKLWALNKRKPWFHLFFDALRGFFPASIVGVPKSMRPVGWLDPRFVKGHRAVLTGYPSRVKLFGPLPTFQENMWALDALRRQLACSSSPSEPPYEKRYPFLDRTLLEFLYAIPREQLLRPGQRRSLMRRALVGIVPDEILNRKRKAFSARSPITTISARWNGLNGTQLMSQALGFINANAFAEEVERARRGQEVHTVAMLRALLVERWLRSIWHHGVLKSESSKIRFGPYYTADAPPVPNAFHSEEFS